MIRSTVLFWPLLAQIAWTLGVAGLTGRARVAALKAREVRLGDVALGNQAWPDDVKKWGNNLANQFETPTLFYTLCIVATLAGATNLAMAGLAWLYVASRVGHTLVHTGANDVRLRFNIFLAGVAALGAMAIGVAWALV